MPSILSVTRSLLVSAPRERVSEYLRDLSRLVDYEQKVDHCQVSYPEPHVAQAELSGRYFGLPWSGSFKVLYTRDGGYEKEMTHGSFRRFTGGFRLRSVSGGTIVTHEETYLLPLAFRVLRPMVRRWLARTIVRELEVIKEGAERLHRQRQLADIDRDVQLA